MQVDKNLFLYDLAVVSIMKNTAPYVKEWLDYHLLAGVNHFFIYDNDSEDNFKEILQPYIDAGLVTYIFYPGKRRQIDAYNEAVQNFKYLCRYMAFVDDDEFILPRNNRSISEVVEEILKLHYRVEGVEIPLITYGSSGHKKADYTRGVLERFTHRMAEVTEATKTVLNPRKVKHMWTTHFAVYFDGFLGVREKDFKASPNVDFTLQEKIVVNHYHTKSFEEYLKRKSGGDAVFGDAWKNIEKIFEAADSNGNEVFDDEILRYRAARKSELAPNGDALKIFSERNDVDADKIFLALTHNLLPADLGDDPVNFLSVDQNQLEYFHAVSEFYKSASQDFFQGKLETFMTCLGVSSFLKKNFPDESLYRNFEKISLTAVVKTLQAGSTVADLQFLIQEMPQLLALPYPAVNTIRKICAKMIVEWRNTLRDSITDGSQLKIWEEIFHWDYHLKMLEVFDNYNHK